MSWISRARSILGSPDAGAGPATVLGLGLWFGLATGIAEVGLLLFEKRALGLPLEVGPQFVWMVPVGDMFLFAFPAVGMALLAWLVSGSLKPRLVVTVFVFITSFALLLFTYYHIATIHVAALLLLAAGVAFQVGRLLADRWSGLLRVVRLTAIPMAATVALAGVGVSTWSRVSESRVLGELPEATAEAPNVLLIILDTVRAMSMSVYGRERPTTPRMEELARRGVLFERPVATAPWTLTSHASMFTGRYPFEMSADWEVPLDDTYPTLAEYLRDHGYATAGFVANLRYCSTAMGLARGFVHYEDYPVSPGQIYLSTAIGGSRWGRYPFGRDRLLNRKDAATVSGDFLNWISGKRTRPFFAFLNYYDAHDPYAPEAPYDMMFLEDEPIRRHLQIGRRHAPEEVEDLRDAYEGALAYLDMEIGRLMDELAERGVLDNTLVIITSDHGEEFAEHGVVNHGNTLYMPGLDVPLLILFTGRVPEGRTVAEPVGLRDIPATVVDLLGLERSAPFPGRSLARHWDGSEPPYPEPLLSEVSYAERLPDWYPVSAGDMKSIVLGDYHYIKNGDGREELYDLTADPLEQRDLAASPEHRQALERSRAALQAIVGTRGVTAAGTGEPSAVASTPHPLP